MKNSTTKFTELDVRFARLIDQCGYPKFERELNYFEALVRNIIYQQLNAKATSIIYNQFSNQFKSKAFPSPIEIFDTGFENLAELPHLKRNG